SSVGRVYQSKPEARPSLSIGVFSFAVSQLMQEENVTALPIEDLMYSRNDFAALGSVFRLTESDLIAKLELMQAYIPDQYEIRETAGIHQLYRLSDIEPVEYIKKHYADMQKGLAA
nr:DUF4007 family protein [Gammaproteobacteria bacterium]